MIETTYEVWQDGIKVAAVSSKSKLEALKEISHYARKYAEDGPIEVRGPFERRQS
jgi:hypothetical protein